MTPTSTIAPQPSERLLLFAKYPVPGQVKTRLMSALDAARAARLHRRLAEAALDTASAAGAPVVVCAAGASLRRFRAWFGRQATCVRQCDGDLGRRLEDAFARAFRRGASKAVAIGADVPGLTPALLREAMAALNTADVVLGPATDGGYYLIGMCRLHRQLFRHIAWGSGEVLSRTRAILVNSGVSYRELRALSDVDRPADLALVRDDPRFSDALDESPRLAIVIPTLNEERSIASTLAKAQTARNVEIVVADGGSTDRTREIAQSAGAQVFHVSGGRATQLNAGAAASSAKRLLFLHGDTRLPEQYDAALHAALDDPSIALGAFCFRTDWDTPAMRVIAWGANIRSKRLGLPYGDQGLFVERRVFDLAGGFPLRRIMEDYEFVLRLRRRGRIATVAPAVTTSARRWRALGPWRVWMLNQAMILGYALGLSDTQLASAYRGWARRVNRA